MSLEVPPAARQALAGKPRDVLQLRYQRQCAGHVRNVFSPQEMFGEA